MEKSIIDILAAKGYHIESSPSNPIVKKIDKLLLRKRLEIKIIERGRVWVNKNGFEYNMKLYLYSNPNDLAIEKKRYVYMGYDLDLEFLVEVFETFLKE